jgi:hypothetical protein
MIRHKKTKAWVAVFALCSTFVLMETDAAAQGRKRNEASIRQSTVRKPPAAKPPAGRPPTSQLPANKPPSSKPPAKTPPPPPGYRPPVVVVPPPRPIPPPPPVYRPYPPRYHGTYYRSYSAWEAAVGIAAVIAVGTILATLPQGHTTVVVKKKTYYVHRGVYYERVVYGDEIAYQVVLKP